jgi:hypothetical protein
MEYYFGIKDIPDDRVVDQLLGIPTYKLQRFIDVRKSAVGGLAAQQWAWLQVWLAVNKSLACWLSASATGAAAAAAAAAAASNMCFI